VPHAVAVSMYTPESECHGHGWLDHIPDAGQRADHRSDRAGGAAGHPAAVPVIGWHHHGHGWLDHVPDAGQRADHRSAGASGAGRRPAGYGLPGIRPSQGMTACTCHPGHRRERASASARETRSIITCLAWKRPWRTERPPTQVPCTAATIGLGSSSNAGSAFTHGQSKVDQTFPFHVHVPTSPRRSRTIND